MTARLPAPVRRYVGNAFAGGTPTIETMELRGRGRVHIGRLPCLPIDARMYHRLGQDYVGLIRLRVAGLTILPVIDAYVAEGFNFLALKLVPGQGVDSMRPVRVTTPGAAATLPLRMVAAGTGGGGHGNPSPPCASAT